MEISSERSDLGTLSEIVRLYDQLGEGKTVHTLQIFLLLAQTIIVLQARTGVFAASALENVQEHVDAITTGLRSHIEAQLGPVIGELASRVREQIEAEIQTCQGESAQQEPKTALDRLCAQYETPHVRKLWCELEDIRALYERFVTGSGKLS